MAQVCKRGDHLVQSRTSLHRPPTKCSVLTQCTRTRSCLRTCYGKFGTGRAAYSPRREAVERLLGNCQDMAESVRRASVDALTRVSSKGNVAVCYPPTRYPVIETALRLINDPSVASLLSSYALPTPFPVLTYCLLVLGCCSAPMRGAKAYDTLAKLTEKGDDVGRPPFDPGAAAIYGDVAACFGCIPPFLDAAPLFLAKNTNVYGSAVCSRIIARLGSIPPRALRVYYVMTDTELGYDAMRVLCGVQY
eukprot:3942002-Rhodomonas_salina.6